jgi:hypothetical protein
VLKYSIAKCQLVITYGAFIMVLLSILFSIIAAVASAFLYAVVRKYMFATYGKHFQVESTDLLIQKILVGILSFLLLVFSLPNFHILSSTELMLSGLWVLILALLAVMDLFFCVLPDVLLMALIAVEVWLVFIAKGNVLLSLALGLGYAVAAFLIFLGIRQAVHRFKSNVEISEVLGFGDIKLIAILAFYLTPISLVLSMLIASLAAILVMVPVRFFKKGYGLLPYGLFICLGAWAVKIFALSSFIMS